jgi:predicted AAA+ superfamily ATPase
MIKRPFWTERLAAGWKHAAIVWLTGPRRVGKTVLAQSLSDAEFLNCDLPGVAERLRDPESFYRSVKNPFVVFDEVHQLPDPSRLLKIGADEFPGLKILATGSSTPYARSNCYPSGGIVVPKGCYPLAFVLG